MRFQRTLLIILASSLLLAGHAQAGDYSRSGVYAGVNGAYGIDLFGDDLRGAAGLPAGVVDMGNSWGLNARLGGRLLSFLALEFQYEWMHGIPVNFLGLEVATFKPHTITGNLKFYIPIKIVQPYILAGAGVGIWKLDVRYPLAIGQLDQSSTGFAARLGAGVDIYLTEKVALNVEGAGVLNTTSFDISSADDLSGLYYFSVSAGILYRF
ncbi:MAG: outer membrane beta-barrel protein [Deltaproteobacteria bacterium]|nr:outer membrane beta-barrel protein [Deltaproteobacteria bacterium]MBW2384695.1 outer membrane beta-barrel protein [Deltaproteobacteria bacterium]MBW2697464.1 outer membrane beta-barrel protein [Deltaproteobacteria bacterium]